MLLAHVWDGEESLVGRYASEKLNGERAIWEDGELITRLGNKVNAPDWWLDKLPRNIPLDGELMGKDWETMRSIVSRKIPDERWNQITYHPFDIPIEGQKFVDSIAVIDALEETQFLKKLEFIEIKEMKQFHEFFQTIVSRGGEGVMVRKPLSTYMWKTRTHELLKVKPCIEGEAVITGFTAGKGRNLGKVGALEVAWQGKHFKIASGLNDDTRKRGFYSVGDVVEFEYSKTTKYGIPSEARLVKGK